MKTAVLSPAAFGAALLFILGPLAALASRAMPVWLLIFAGLALFALWRRGVRPAPPFSDYVKSAPLAAWSAVALIAWAFFSILWSPSPRALLTAAEIAYVFIGAWAIGAWWRVLDEQERRRWLVWFAAGLTAGMALFVEEALFGYPLYRLWAGPRPVEIIMGGNVPKRAAALLALFAWPLALFVGKQAVGGAFDGGRRDGGRRDGGRRGAAAAAAVLAASLLVCLQSASRTSVFGLAAGAAAAGLAAAGLAGFVRRLLTVACVVAFAAAVPAGGWLARATADWDAEGYFHSALHRMEIWGHAAERIERRPLLGHGIDASRVLPKENETSRFNPLQETVMPLHPHNLYLQVWLELGAVGAAIGALLTAGLAFATRRLRGMDAALTLGLLGGGLAMASEAYGIWQAWWMSGMAVAGLLTWFQLNGGQETRQNQETRP